MKVCIFRASDGACDYYRTLLPVNAAMNHGLVQKTELWISNLLVKITYDQSRFSDAMQSDVYFLQRVPHSQLIQKLRSFSKESKINASLVMDHDDDVFHVSPFSESYIDYGTEEIKIVHDGKLIHEWKDGVNLSLSDNRKRLDEYKRTCASVDMITTTSEHLAGIFREFNENVRVLPNCVDLNGWKRLNIVREKREEVRICWAGGASHWEDLHLIRDSLKAIADKYKNVKIVMVGYMPGSMKNDFRPEQLEFHPWVETPAHPYRLAALDIDIALIPLKDTMFSRSKSTIKWVEFGSLSIPSITSYVPPYDAIQDADQNDKGIFVENNDPQAWIKGMELLINDIYLRKRLADNAYQFVKDHHDINTQYHRWVDAFNEAKCLSPAIRS